jgi:hypothetical protein
MPAHPDRPRTPESSLTMPEIPEALEDAAMFAARQAQQQASPLQQSPWLSRLVGNVVRTTLELAVEQLKPEITLPDRDDLARELFMRDNSKGRPDRLLIDWNDLVECGDAYTHALADVAIEAFKAANQ